MSLLEDCFAVQVIDCVTLFALIDRQLTAPLRRGVSPLVFSVYYTISLFFGIQPENSEKTR